MHLMIWIQIHSRETKPTLCAAILDTILLQVYVFEFENIRIHCPQGIGFIAGLFFPTLESRFKNIRSCCQICQMGKDGGRIQKEKVAD